MTRGEFKTTRAKMGKSPEALYFTLKSVICVMWGRRRKTKQKLTALQ